jgi:integrase
VKLLDELGEPYRTMVQLIAATGLRIGELLALRGQRSTWKSAHWRCGSQCSRWSSQDSVDKR